MVKKFIKKYIYDARGYAGKLLWIDTLGFHIDFRKWYYSTEDYKIYNRDWSQLSWVPEWELEQKEKEYFKPIPISWKIAYCIINWRYRTPVKWMTVGYLICAIIKS